MSQSCDEKALAWAPRPNRTALDWAVYKADPVLTRIVEMHGTRQHEKFIKERHKHFVKEAKHAEALRTAHNQHLVPKPDIISLVKRKLTAAAYRLGGPDWKWQFRNYGKLW